MRAVVIAAVFVSVAGPASAEPVYCSVWQGIRTCSSPGGYVTHETTWDGLVTGSDTRGNRWTTSRWRDIETTTVEPSAR
jgi:hypothetical protein